MASRANIRKPFYTSDQGKQTINTGKNQLSTVQYDPFQILPKINHFPIHFPPCTSLNELELWTKREFRSDRPSPTSSGTISINQSLSNPDYKIAIKSSQLGPNQFTDPINEARFPQLLCTDNHRGILPIHAAYLFPQDVIVITPELYPSLFRYCLQTPKTDRSLKEIFQIFESLCHTLDYLHNFLGVAHLNLKLENILLNSSKMPILSNFQCAVIAELPNHIINTSQPGFRTLKNMVECLHEQITAPTDSQHFSTFLNKSSLPKFSISLGEFKLLENIILEKHNINICSFVDCLQISSSQSAFQSQTQQPQHQFWGPEGEEEVEDQIETIQKWDFHTYQLDENCLSDADSHQKFFQHVLLKLTQRNCDDEAMDELLRITFISNLPPKLYSLLISTDICTFVIGATTISKGTMSYAAPEILNQRNPTYNPFKADIYSLGVILFILLYGFVPYREAKCQSSEYSYLLQLAAQPVPPGSIRNPIITQLVAAHGQSNKYPATVTALLDCMMDFNPARRLSIKRIINECLPSLCDACVTEPNF